MSYPLSICWVVMDGSTYPTPIGSRRPPIRSPRRSIDQFCSRAEFRAPARLESLVVRSQAFGSYRGGVGSHKRLPSRSVPISPAPNGSGLEATSPIAEGSVVLVLLYGRGRSQSGAVQPAMRQAGVRLLSAGTLTAPVPLPP
jgi:hypothetical protein